jgi:hypothetical protein
MLLAPAFTYTRNQRRGEKTSEEKVKIRGR